MKSADNPSFDFNDLITQAKEVCRRAYAPYSKFKVGAALLTSSGAVFTGCNVENASYGATLCAERNAVAAAVAAGEKEFAALAVVAGDGSYAFPCGICRQVLSEFNQDITVILSNAQGQIMQFKLTDLLPHAFDLNSK